MTRIQGLLVVAGGAVALSAATASAAEPTVSRDEVRAIVAEMLQDAQSRSSLQGSAANAGYENGFFISSGDGNNRLNVNAFGQIRYTANFRQPGASDLQVDPATGPLTNQPGAPFTSENFGFSLRRAAVILSGNVINPDLTFKFRLISESAPISFQPTVDASGVPVGGGDFFASDSDIIFDDAYGRYQFLPGWFVQAGQFRTPFTREFFIAETKTLAADYSIVQDIFGGDYTQGILLEYQQPEWGFYASFNDGLGSIGTEFNSFQGSPTFPVTGQAAYAVTARGEWYFAGSRQQLEDFTSLQSDPYAGVVGAAVHWQQSRRLDSSNFPSTFDPLLGGTTSTGATADILTYTLDAQVEANGWSVYAGFVGNFVSIDPIAGSVDGDENDTDSYGVVVQGSYRFLPELEAFARWDGLFFDQGLFSSASPTSATELRLKNLQFLTFGLNYYLAGHAAKFTLDTVFAFNPASRQDDSFGTFAGLGGSSVLSSTQGLLGATNGFEAALRAQFQFAF